MRIYTNSLQSRSASSYLVYRVFLTAEPPFASGRQSLPTDEAGFRVAEPTFDGSQLIHKVLKLNRETNTYKDTYLIGATKLQRNTHLVVANLAHSTYAHFYHALGCVWDGVE